MRRRLVDSYTDPDTDIQYGLRGSPVDFALAQVYTHDHVQQATRDFLMKNSASSLVEGFDYTLAGQLKLSIAAGRAYDAAGVFYETVTDPAGQPTVVTLDAADPAQPRIDLVYAVLEAEVQALPLTRMFRRVASEAELTANGGRNPYLPQPIERFSEEHARARILVRKGVAAAVPVAPAANAGEVPLFQVRVNAGAAVLVAGNVTDVRNRTRSLATALALIDALNANPIITDFTEKVQDALSAFFPDAAPFDWTVDDAGNRVALDIATATAGQKGLMSAADYSKLAASTSAATVSALAQRDANGDIAFRDVTLRNAVLSNKVTTYNGVATALMGIAPILAGNDAAVQASTSGTIYTAPPDGLYQLDLGILTKVVGTGGTAVLAVAYKDGSPAPSNRSQTLPAISLTTNDRQLLSVVIHMIPTANLTFTLTITGAAGPPTPEVFYWYVLRRLK